MSEACDVVQQSSLAEAIPSEVVPPEEEDLQPEPLALRPGEQPAVGEQCRAVFFYRKGNQQSDDIEEQEAFEYVRYLEDCGFIVKSEPSDSVQQIEDEIKNAAKDAKQLVAVVLMESDSPSDLDRIVSCLRDANPSTQKLLIFCRISDTESEEKADCMKLMRPMDCQKNLRNIVLLSIAVKARKEAVKFLHILADLKKKSWHSKGLGEVIQYEIQRDVYDRFKLKTQNGLTSEFIQPPLPVKMLKDNEEFAKIIGNGSYLRQLDSETIERLKQDPNHIEDVVYSIDSCKGKKALIIHNVNFLLPTGNRPESYMDFKNLSHVLTLMQFEVSEKVNLTAAKIREAVRDFANDESHGDACVLVIMSHGSLGAICGTDYRRESNLGLVRESEILNLMSKGTGVKAKPRLVLVQACLADSSESQTREPAMRSENVCATMVETAIQVGIHQGNPACHVEPPPDQSGMIVAHSTSPGHYAFRSRYGSRFILALCATFYEFAQKEDLISMLTRINFIMVRGFKRPELNGEILSLQMPCWTVQTYKKFFLVDTSCLFSGQAEARENQLEQQSEVVIDSKSNAMPFSSQVSIN